MPDLSALADAIAHLRVVRATLGEGVGDVVTPAARLRAADLDIVIAAASLQLRADQAASSDLEPGGSLSADDLGGMA